MFAEAIGDHALGKGLKFRDAWGNRIRYKFANLEQGVLKPWHYGWIVLVGDSCHKMTPNQALGANNALESVCSLTNHLYDLLASVGDGPNFEALDEALEAYQKQRYPRAKKSHNMTTFYTKMAAWGGFGLETVSRWLPTTLS
jgi:2-polyprenyl-6-methoxyphenol hydroxylase-like FAD-dependent oxidoreductase